MSIKSFFAIPFAKNATKKVKKWANNPLKTQEKVFQKLISKGRKTAYGKDHDFLNIHNYEDFKKRIKVQDYEGLRAYVDRILAGESDVLWPGKPLYFAKTSGIRIVFRRKSYGACQNKSFLYFRHRCFIMLAFFSSFY